MGVTIIDIKVEPYSMYLTKDGSIMIVYKLDEPAIYIEPNGELSFDTIEVSHKIVKKLSKKDINIQITL